MLIKYYQDEVTMSGQYRRITGFALDYACTPYAQFESLGKDIREALAARKKEATNKRAISCKRICIRIAYGETRQEVRGNLSASWSERATRNLHFACKHAWTTHCRS